MAEIFLRKTSKVSLLEKNSGKSMKIINAELSDLLMKNNDYFFRCLSQIENGKTEFLKLLDDAKHVIFKKEDLIYWLYKIEEDVKTKTGVIFIEYKVSRGLKEKDIDFEKAGFLAGIYEEAERYLTLILAIEPLDKNKSHYSILDRLEKLDENYINTDNIPGYYCIQRNKKILKQKYEIKKLEDYLPDFLSIKDDCKVSEGFDNSRYLFTQYHFEFKLELIKIRPREDIKDFLNFHLKKYIGDKMDFINHIKYRVLPKLDDVAGSDYLIYQQLLEDWLKEKQNKLNQVNEVYLLESVVSVSASFVDSVTNYRKMQDENKYNSLLCGFLSQRFSSKSWNVKDQSLGGSSNSKSKANKAGMAFRDIIVTDEKNNHISAIECFRLSSIPTQNKSNSKISEHLTKIFRNETIGISPLFILVYCETKSFSKTWEKYLNYINKVYFNKYKMLEINNNIQMNPTRANIKIAKAIHIRETNEINVYHIFINMFPD